MISSNYLRSAVADKLFQEESLRIGSGRQNIQESRIGQGRKIFQESSESAVADKIFQENLRDRQWRQKIARQKFFGIGSDRQNISRENFRFGSGRQIVQENLRFGSGRQICKQIFASGQWPQIVEVPAQLSCESDISEEEQVENFHSILIKESCKHLSKDLYIVNDFFKKKKLLNVFILEFLF
ncbi:hypothetical protein HNY73_016791 [Argiope bruennichi]|uniref:Uncharacterized protein n=1 Tax=Argiope bruennichi TaxID=94029 RepID=A0A8T0ENW8_ARGBR|nr:hypothetical protein HNY73_016791 [Argiope bruennichi]